MRSLLSERSVLSSSALLATNCSLEYICYAVNILPFYIIWWHLTFVVALLDPLFFRHDGNVLYVGFWSRWCGHSPFIWKLLPYFHNLYCYNGQGILITWLANMSSSWGKISYSSRLQTYSKEKSIGIKHRAALLCYRSCVWTVFEDVLPILFIMLYEHLREIDARDEFSHFRFLYSIYHARTVLFFGVLICLLLVYRTRLLKYVIPKANLLGDDAVHTACFTFLTGYTDTSLSPILFTG